MDENQRLTEINDCLSVATKRQTGLIKLSNCLDKCSSSQLIDDHGTFWLRQLLQILDNYPVTMHAKLSHYCLYLLIQQSKCSNELSKLISSSYIDKILNTLISSTEPLTKNSLVCIFELMNCYRGPCTPFKQKIENYVLSKLDSNSEEIVEWASKCYGFLPNIYRAVNNNDIWYTYFSNALFNANQILIEIFDNLINEHNLQIQQTTATINLFKTSLTKDQTNNRYYYEKLSKRFSACLKCLNSLLTCCSEHVAKVRINEIILFLKHLYQLDLKSMLNNRMIATKPEFKHVVEILNQIYKSIMKFSQTFFQTLNTNLLPYSDVINKMIAQFSTTSTEDIFIDTLSIYYDTITAYMQSLGTNCAFSKLCSCVVDNILDYIKPIRSKFIIDLKKESKENLAKKFLNDFIMKQNNNKRSNNVNEKYNGSIIFKYDCVDLTKSCLKCLNNLIHYFSSQINDAEYNKIQKAIIDLIINVQHNYINKEPYSEDECRLELYKCLYELCIATNNASEPPFAVAINLFDNGKSDSSFQVKTYLETVSLSLRAYTDPKIPVTYRYHEYQFDNSLVKRQQQQQQQQVQSHSIFDNRMSSSSFNNVNTNNSNNNNRQYMNENNIQLSNSANNYDITSNSQSNSFKFSMSGSLNENSKQGEVATSQQHLPPASALMPQSSSSYQAQLQQEPQNLINEQPSTSGSTLHMIQNNYENIVNNNHENRNEFNRQTRKRQLSEDEEIEEDDVVNEEVNKKNVYSGYTIEEEVIDDDDDDDDEEEEDDEGEEDEDDEDIEDDEDDDEEEVDDEEDVQQTTSKLNKQIHNLIQKRHINQPENAKRTKIDNGDGNEEEDDEDDDDDELMEQGGDYIDENEKNYAQNEHDNENEKINLSNKTKDNGEEILIDDDDDEEESSNYIDEDDDASKERFRNLNGNNVANVNNNANKNGNEVKVNGETNNEVINNDDGKQATTVTVSTTETASTTVIQSENQVNNELNENKINELNNTNGNQNDTVDNQKPEAQTVEIQTTTKTTTTSINTAINSDTNTVITEIQINQLETKKSENLIETLKENNNVVNNTENNDNELKEMLNSFRPDADPTENR